MKSVILICLSMLLCMVLISGSVPDLVYRNSRVFNVTYSFELVPDPAKIDRTKDLKLWLPVPREWDTQKGVEIVSVDPVPHAEYKDPEHGNPMLFWDFGKEPEQASYKVEIRFRLESYEFHPEIDPEQVGTYDKTSDEYIFYTRSSRTICITPKVIELAKEAVGDEKNPYLQVKQIVSFVMRKVHYKILDFERGRGVQCLLDYPVKDEKTGEDYYLGCCSQRSALITACSRALGIPARSVKGFISPRPWTKEEDMKPLYEFETKLSPTGLAGAQHFGHMIPHVWTEFYIPNYGWIPVDGSRVRSLDNKRWIVSKGRDVNVGPRCPQEDSEGYGTQWVSLNDGRADLLFSGIWNIARIRTARVKLVLTSDPFPADAYTEYADMLYPEAEAERKLREWREYTLGWIDYKTRGRPDKYKALAAAYDTGYRGHLLCYQRGAFICHMLRSIIGDDGFFQIIREYQDLRIRSRKPVSTARFQKIAEETYDKPLDWFFTQWAREMELAEETVLPQLELDEVIAVKDGKDWLVRGHLLQSGKAFFRVPLEIALETEEGVECQQIWQEDRDAVFELHTSYEPKRLTVDPDCEVLKIQKMAPHLFWFWDAYPDLIVIYGTESEADANKAAVEEFNNYLVLEQEKIKADTDVTEEDLKAECIILFGRPATNRIARQFEDAFPIKFDDDRFTWQATTYDQPIQGAVQIIRFPLDPKRLVILCAGLSGEATLRISESYLHDAQSSYAIFDTAQLPAYEWFDLDKVICHGDWERESDLVWDFETDEEL